MADTGEHLVAGAETATAGDERPLRLLAGILIALAIGALLIWLVSLAVG